MHNTRRIYLSSTLIILLTCIFIISADTAFSEKSIEEMNQDDVNRTRRHSLEIICIDVSKGDSTLIISPSDNTMLIDTGMTGFETLQVLEDQGIETLDYLLSTHFDADHIGGIDRVVAGSDGIYDTDDDIEILNVLDRGDDNIGSTGYISDYLEAVNHTGTERRTPTPGEILDIGGGVKATVVCENGNIIGGSSADWGLYENDRSVGVHIVFGEFDMLICGDLTASLESMVASDLNRRGVEMDVIHLDHHGSSSSTPYSMVEELRPENAVVSVGSSNSYGHPRDEVIYNLRSLKGPCGQNWFDNVYVTELGSQNVSEDELEVVHGDIMISTDGDRYSIDGDDYPSDTTDSDNDGIFDVWEIRTDLDPEDGSDGKLDRDKDGLTEMEEFLAWTCPSNNDTDDDGLPDGWETKYGLDPLKRDHFNDEDNDGLDNGEEYNRNMNPVSSDSDNDTLPDKWEVLWGTDPIMDDASEDDDSDGASNIAEYQAGTDPEIPDTDGDGIPDGWELEHSLDPISPYDAQADPDGDNITNIKEFESGSNPQVHKDNDTGQGDDDSGEADGGKFDISDNSVIVFMIMGAFIMLMILVTIFLLMRRRKRKKSMVNDSSIKGNNNDQNDDAIDKVN